MPVAWAETMLMGAGGAVLTPWPVLWPPETIVLPWSRLLLRARSGFLSLLHLGSVSCLEPEFPPKALQKSLVCAVSLGCVDVQTLHKADSAPCLGSMGELALMGWVWKSWPYPSLAAAFLRYDPTPHLLCHGLGMAEISCPYPYILPPVPSG